METTTIHLPKTHLSRLIACVEAGHEIIICRGKQPVARLVGLQTTLRGRPPVGTVTSPPITWDEDAFSLLSDAELAEWGL